MEAPLIRGASGGASVRVVDLHLQARLRVGLPARCSFPPGGGRGHSHPRE